MPTYFSYKICYLPTHSCLVFGDTLIVPTSTRTTCTCVQSNDGLDQGGGEEEWGEKNKDRPSRKRIFSCYVIIIIVLALCSGKNSCLLLLQGKICTCTKIVVFFSIKYVTNKEEIYIKIEKVQADFVNFANGQIQKKHLRLIWWILKSV